MPFKQLLITVWLLLTTMPGICQDQPKDSERLGMALEYFKSSKYHEALMLFSKLNEKYELNPRFHAYMGLCYYKEWDYNSAVTEFTQSLPHLKRLYPHELSVYYNALAESRFNLAEYEEAISAYEKVITLCHPNERAECLYRIGLCYIELKQWTNATEALTSALAYYEKYLDTPMFNARITQIRNMIKGCKSKAKDSTKH